MHGHEYIPQPCARVDKPEEKRKHTHKHTQAYTQTRYTTGQKITDFTKAATQHQKS